MKPAAIVGVDLGGTNIRTGKVQGDAVVRHFASYISAQADERTVLSEVVEAIEHVFDLDTVGIGIGVPSLVDVEKGIVYEVQNIPSWQEVPLKDWLEEQFGVPVLINNDANCFAVGELHFGKAARCRHLVGITLGTGLGAGVIIDRKLYSGASCGAGEIGTIPYRDGIIENYCSGQYFLRRTGLTGEELLQQAEAGDREARQVFSDFGHELGQAVLIALYAYDPQVVVLGGSVVKSWKWFEASMRDRLREFAYPHAMERISIIKSERPDIAILGGAALYLDSLERS